MERTVVYFEKPGRDNTAACLDVVWKALAGGSHRHIVVASTTGETGVLFSHAFKGRGINLVIVTHAWGHKEPNTFELTDDARERIVADGARIYTGSLPTSSIETSFANKFSGLYPTTIVAQSLRRFGEGTKVGCEIVMMATDAGMIPEGEEVIAVAGTARGADTALIVRSAASKRFLDLRVLEILAKPRA